VARASGLRRNDRGDSSVLLAMTFLRAAATGLTLGVLAAALLTFTLAIRGYALGQIWWLVLGTAVVFAVGVAAVELMRRMEEPGSSSR
jgi:uncharacterized membrane protein